MAEQARILLIDDEINVIHALKRILEHRGYELIATENPDEAMNIIERGNIDLIICDQQLPGYTGIDILKYSVKIMPEAIRILITGYSDLNVAISAINEGSIFRYISKPWDNKELLNIVETGLNRKKEADANRLLLQTAKDNGNLAEISDKIKMIQNILEQPLVKKVKSQNTSMGNRYQTICEKQNEQHLNDPKTDILKKRIPIWDNEEIILMRPSELYFFAAINGEVVIFTQSGKYISTETLNHWEKKLEGMNFFRSHRSYIVNIDKIEKISPWFHGAYNLKLKDINESIPVSRNASKGLKEYIDF